MATTITAGVGGTYTTFKSAYDATTGDDFIIEMVGNTTEDAVTMLKNQGGYEVTVKGNGYTINTAYDFVTVATAPNGGIVFEDNLTVNQTATSKTLITTNHAGAGTGSIVFRYSRATGGWVRIVYDGALSYESIMVYGCDCVLGSSGATAFTTLNACAPLYVEDNIIRGVTYTNQNGINSANTTSSSKMFFKRNYFNLLDGAAHLFVNDASNIAYITTETYYNLTDAYLTADYEGKTFSDAEFMSVVLSDPDYGVPLPLSTLTTTASQDTNIPDNIIGLNGVTVGTRAAGAYTPNVYILAPTGLGYTVEDTGIKIDWTNTVQAQYPDTDIYWETVPSSSAFLTPKATVGLGISTYTIPYSSLATSSLWYVRLTHAE